MDETSCATLAWCSLTCGAYLGGEARIAAALDDFEKETERAAMPVEPVRMNTDEFYHILRKRIFEKLPEVEEVGLVAQGYAHAIRDAKQMDVTNASPEQFARQVAESYPFHPAIRDLYARFRENQGFQQTRGLIRLMRIVVSRIWATDQDPYLIAAQDLDLASQETLSEINQINSTLANAIVHDITSDGQAVAEILDANRGQGPDAQDIMRLLLVASLANVPNAVKGLAVPEIIANLCAPGRDVAGLQHDVIARLATAAWYLHSTNDGRLHLRNVQNLIARVTTTAGAYLRDQANTELKDRLTEIFEPEERNCYQRLQALPPIDEIDIDPSRVSLIVAEPHAAGLHPDLITLYDQHTYRNRICFLTDQRAFDSLLDRARELKAITQVIAELNEEGIADGDPQMQQARETLLPRFLAQFHSAIRETFTTLYYPTRDRLSKVDFLMEFRDNRYDGEEQVREALVGKQKFTNDVTGETFRKKVEQRLFTQQSMPWSEITRRAATSPVWQWHRPDALERMKADCVHKDIWREEGSYVDKGPFPKPETAVRIQEVARDDDTGVTKLRLTPVNGDTLYADVDRGNDYPDSSLGLRHDEDRGWSADLTYAPSPAMTLAAFRAVRETDASTAGSSVFGPADWWYGTRDAVDTDGLTLELRELLRDGLRVTVTYSRSKGRGRYQTAPGDLETGFPDLLSEHRAVDVRARYRMTRRSVLVLRYYLEDYGAADWALDGLGLTAARNVLSFGRDLPDYGNALFSVSVETRL